MDQVSTDYTKHHEAVKELLDWASDHIEDDTTWEPGRDVIEARFMEKIADYGQLDLGQCVKQCDPHDLLKRSMANYLDGQFEDCNALHYLAYYVATHKT